MARLIGSGLGSQLHREARERALNIVMEASDEAARIVREAQDAARQLVEGAVARSEALQEGRLRQADAQARLAARRQAVSHRQEIRDALWQQAAERLRRMADAPGEVRAQILGNLIEDAAAQLAGDGWQMEIAVAAHDRPLMTQPLLDALVKRLREYGVIGIALSDHDLHATGGVVVRKVASREIVVNTFDERLALTRRTLRDEVERRLAPASEGTDAAQA